MIPRIFDGSSCIVVGGGPSLIGFDFERLRRRRTIAINRSLEVVQDARVLWWSDAPFWRLHKDQITNHPAGFKATCSLGYQPLELPSWVNIYRLTGRGGFDPNPGCLCHGNNSGYAATHLAVHLGAKRIVLLGIDMRFGPKGETHFHSGHPTINSEDTLTRYMVPFFSSLKAELDKLGVEVLNASPDSALQIWPRCSIDEGLRAYDEFQAVM